MRIFTCFSRRAWIGAAIAGVIVSVAGYLVMTIVPRRVIALESYARELAFSGDFRLAAVKSSRTEVQGRRDEIVHVWNTSNGHLLFSRPIQDEFFPDPPRGIGIAFDEDTNCLVVFGGKLIGCQIKRYELPSGANGTAPCAR